MLHLFMKFAANILVILPMSYLLIIARDPMNATAYHKKDNFLILLLVTAIFLFFYNLTAQLSMGLWYKWNLSSRHILCRMLFVVVHVTIWVTILCAFAEFTLRLVSSSITAYGYLYFEVPLFVVLFVLSSLLAIYWPVSNPFEVLFRSKTINPSEDISAVEECCIMLDDKQAIVSVPISVIVLLWCTKRKVYVLCRDQRILETGKMKMKDFHSLCDGNLFIQINRTASVKKAYVEGYSPLLRDIAVRFVPEVQAVVDVCVVDPKKLGVERDVEDSTVLTRDKLRVTGAFVAAFKRLF